MSLKDSASPLPNTKKRRRLKGGQKKARQGGLKTHVSSSVGLSAYDAAIGATDRDHR